jgi:hypothetical protein
MPLGELAVDAIGGIFRVAGRILIEVFFELLIKGAGYVLIRMIKPKPAPTETECAIVGLLFWLAVGIGGYYIYHATAA